MLERRLRPHREQRHRLHAQLANADTCLDTLRVTGGFDIEDFGGDNVRVPAVGNLPISNVSGNAVCCAGPTLPCFVGPPASVAVVPAAVTGCGDLPLPGAATAGLVSFRQNQYVVQSNDPNPLPDQANITGNDLCNAGAVGCSTGGDTCSSLPALNSKAAARIRARRIAPRAATPTAMPAPMPAASRDLRPDAHPDGLCAR